MYGYYNNYMNMYYPEMMDVDPIRYPDIYYIVYPMVRRKCEMMDMSYNPSMYPYPSYEMIEKMIDELYEECKKQHPEMFKQYKIESESETKQFFGPRGLFRGLLGILLIREILDRRRRFGYQPYGYGPWYGIGGYGYY